MLLYSRVIKATNFHPVRVCACVRAPSKSQRLSGWARGRVSGERGGVGWGTTRFRGEMEWLFYQGRVRLRESRILTDVHARNSATGKMH
jgi:hypothetical protein